MIDRNQPFIDAMIDDAGDYFWKHYIPRLRALQSAVAQAQGSAGDAMGGGAQSGGDHPGPAKRARDEPAVGASSSCSSSSSSSGGGDGDGSGGSAKKVRSEGGAMPGDHKEKMKSLSRIIVLCADGAPVHIIRRFYDEEAEAEAAAAAAEEAEAAISASARTSTKVSAGGFHFGKETYTVNGHEYGDVFLRHLISTIRPSEGQKK